MCAQRWRPDPAHALNVYGGAATASQLAAVGLSQRTLMAAVAKGHVVRTARGIYASPSAPEEVQAARECHAVLTCASAAGHYGLWQLHRPNVLHLAARHRRLPSGVVDHRSPVPEKPGLSAYAPLSLVLLHALHCLPDIEALILVESATRVCRLDVSVLRDQLPGNRNGPARAVLDLVEPGADSLLETIARVLFRRAGFRAQAQVHLPGIGWVDFLLEEFLIVELDGGTHLEPRQFKKDRRRDNAAVLSGFLVLRFFYDDVVHHPERMLDQIRRALAGRPVH
jgi:very-short-patch-repair endonuclease